MTYAQIIEQINNMIKECSDNANRYDGYAGEYDEVLFFYWTEQREREEIKIEALKSVLVLLTR